MNTTMCSSYVLGGGARRYKGKLSLLAVLSALDELGKQIGVHMPQGDLQQDRHTRPDPTEKGAVAIPPDTWCLPTFKVLLHACISPCCSGYTYIHTCCTCSYEAHNAQRKRLLYLFNNTRCNDTKRHVHHLCHQCSQVLNKCPCQQSAAAA